ncbi:uncharacterized protein N7479_003072, partial [Penicillium vulpinum]|uniref:uncharacterized protein n=1 Tax=Penicillium vulpinum TaxID=29845 RepID=UPI002548B781
IITDRKSWILREKPNLFVLIRYLLSGTLLPRLYIYIPLSTILLILLVELFLFIFRNGVFPLRPYSRASIRYNRSKEVTPLKVRIVLIRPLYIEVGQYISLWIPADILELFVQPRRGLTKTIYYRTALDSYTSLTVFVNGPYRVSKSVDYYEYILVIATDFGIVGIISYLKKLLYGAPGPDISDDDLVNWDTWLTPEALYDKKYLATSQYSFINIGDCTEQVPLLLDRSLQLIQSTDSNKEIITIGLQTLSLGVYTFAKRGNTEIQPIVINEKE